MDRWRWISLSLFLIKFHNPQRQVIWAMGNRRVLVYKHNHNHNHTRFLHVHVHQLPINTCLPVILAWPTARSWEFCGFCGPRAANDTLLPACPPHGYKIVRFLLCSALLSYVLLSYALFCSGLAWLVWSFLVWSGLVWPGLD